MSAARVAVVTDSTADLPAALMAQYAIHVVPNFLVINGQSLEDGAGISRAEFYKRLPHFKTTPTTATASAGAFSELYRKLLNEGYQTVVSIHLSHLLSGVMNAASAGAAEFGRSVQVIDSGSLSMGVGFQALAAAEIAAQGAGPDEVLALVNDVRRRVRVVAMLDTLEYVRRSGRVSWMRSRIGNLLQIKPFLEVAQEGQVRSLGEARTRTKGIQRLKETLLQLGPLERVAILHSNAESDARQFQLDLPTHPPHDPLVVLVTTVIGTHVGPNGLGFAAVVK